MIDKERIIFVLIETKDSVPKTAGLELLSAGKKIASSINGKLYGIILGFKNDEAIRTVSSCGPDVIISVDNPQLNTFNLACYFESMKRLTAMYCPNTILIGASDGGRALAPHLSAYFNTGLTADCTDISVADETDTVVWTRPAFSGNVYAQIVCESHYPQMGTIRQGIFQIEMNPRRKQPIVIQEKIELSTVGHNIIVTSIKDNQLEKYSFTGADIVVSGGAGTNGKEGFALVEQLASALGAKMGASRAAVNNGWIPYSRQIGQSGSTIRPRIYIACGISGATQHMAGIVSGTTIIAINKDKRAPIFDYADYGIVGDLFDILPPLIKKIGLIKN